MRDESTRAQPAAEAPVRTVLREATGRGPAAVLVEANDRLQNVRNLLAAALSPKP